MMLASRLEYYERLSGGDGPSFAGAAPWQGLRKRCPVRCLVLLFGLRIRRRLEVVRCLAS